MLELSSQLPDREIEKVARRLRLTVLEMITEAKSGHPGGSLSVLDIVLALYFFEMRQDPNNPHWSLRDRFVLSKGHGVPALYAVLAECGYFSREKLLSLRQLGSPLQGHPANALLPGIEASTGSLGQGLSVAQGMALAGKLRGDKNPAYRVYAVIGDGELQEGQIWETAMSAPRLGANNLLVFIDRNKGQIDGWVDQVMGPEPLKEKWEAFGWQVLEIDGHNYEAIRRACAKAKAEKEKPTVVIAHTLKGKGVSFLEADTVGWHGKATSREQLEKARQELSEVQL